MGSDFRLDLSVKEGAGAFVCGEETALLASIEGRRGMPRLRPPYPAEADSGASPRWSTTWRPTPWCRGSCATAPRRSPRIGTPTSPGTKVFALAGKVRRGGLIEVPMGVTMRQIVEEIGGGVAACRRSRHRQPGWPTTNRFKAVQIGGPSGGCVPAELADTPVDYEALAEVGAIMGSGGLVVLDDADCMVDIARYFLRFTQDQSCGKCTLCRVGTRRMLDILDRICDGRRQARRPRRAGAVGPYGPARAASAAWANGPQPGALHAALFPPRIRGAPGRPLPGGQVQGADPLPRHRRLHRLHALRPALPGRRHPA